VRVTQFNLSRRGVPFPSSLRRSLALAHLSIYPPTPAPRTFRTGCALSRIASQGRQVREMADIGDGGDQPAKRKLDDIIKHSEEELIDYDVEGAVGKIARTNQGDVAGGDDSDDGNGDNDNPKPQAAGANGTGTGTGGEDEGGGGGAAAAGADAATAMAVTMAGGDPADAIPKPNDNVGADMCIRSLAWETTSEGLKTYFETYGKVTTCTVKTGPDGRSRGFGFINFASQGAVQRVLAESHVVDGRRLEILPPRLTDLSATTKIFVGRLEPTVPMDNIRQHFAQFGDVQDVYMPMPHKGFCFVTYADNAAVGRRYALRGSPSPPCCPGDLLRYQPPPCDIAPAPLSALPSAGFNV